MKILYACQHGCVLHSLRYGSIDAICNCNKMKSKTLKGARASHLFLGYFSLHLTICVHCTVRVWCNSITTTIQKSIDINCVTSIKQFKSTFSIIGLMGPFKLIWGDCGKLSRKEEENISTQRCTKNSTYRGY